MLKTLRISDEVHARLTAILGTLMAQSGKMQTYEDAIEALLNKSVVLPPDLLKQIRGVIEEKKELGYTSIENFMQDAIRLRLNNLSGKNES